MDSGACTVRSLLGTLGVLAVNLSEAQSNAIFTGGPGDGIARGALAQSLNTPGVFSGGPGDGMVAGSFAQPLSSAGVFTGGIGDGIVRGSFAQPLNTGGIFTGGSGDGIVRAAFAQPLNTSGVFTGGAGDGIARGLGTNLLVSVQGIALLEGPYNTGTQLMNDALRGGGVIPLTEPYSAMGYPAVAGGGETTTPAVLSVSGNAAPVDWIRVELRDATVPTTVVAVRHALVTRAGSIIDPVTADPVIGLQAQPGNYYVVVRHRNHLGVMTAAPVALAAAAAEVDFTSASTATFGTNARKTVGTVQVLWAGDVTGDHQLKYTGPSNDRDPILVSVGSTTPNNVVTGQYSTRDVNMDGTVKYTGSQNDRDPILVNVGSTTPNNTRTEQVP